MINYIIPRILTRDYQQRYPICHKIKKFGKPILKMVYLNIVAVVVNNN